MAVTSRPCPYCKKPIPAAAKGAGPSHCPHCRHKLATGAPDPTVELGIFPDSPGPATSGKIGPLSAQGLRSQPLQKVSLGDFRVVMKIGTGTTGAVYLARQRGVPRDVALKVLSRQFSSQPAYLQRFQREAEVLARLRHPGIVALYGKGENKGWHFLALEYVNGLNATRLLERRGGRLTVGDAVHIVLSVARTLAYAHSHHVVHRDIKPPHILIGQRGEVKLTDLGLARPTDQEMSLTASGVGLGTPQYMPPEQAHDAKHADERADIYALGGVFYRLLTGQLPFQAAGTVNLLLAKERGRFTAASRVVSGVPRELDPILKCMLAKDPADRYPGCEELIGALDGLGLANERLSFIA